MELLKDPDIHHSAIENHSIPYLDYVRLLPPSLARHLTKHAVQALSPHV